jgi:iron(III) transport system substrate-binding protein
LTPFRCIAVLCTTAALAGGLAACGSDGEGEAGDASAGFVVYSGRAGGLIGPLVDRYEKENGIDIKMRFGDSAELAATMLEEGDNSPADMFFSQDAGALGALQREDRLARLPTDLLDEVDARYRSRAGDWVGTSARARIVAYDKRKLQPSDLPRSVLGLTDPKWKGKIGWAPTNASFQAFITALRVTRGEQVARDFLEGIKRNEPETYESNVPVRDAIANGEIQVGLINHYYVAEAVAEKGADYPVGIYQPPGGDIGSLVNVAGVGILRSSDRQAAARKFARYLLGAEAQRFFAETTKEYPIAAGVRADPSLTPLARIPQPRVDLAKLDDLRGTVDLLRDTGAL